jgi:hypothetical protein
MRLGRMVAKADRGADIADILLGTENPEMNSVQLA